VIAKRKQLDRVASMKGPMNRSAAPIFSSSKRRELWRSYYLIGRNSSVASIMVLEVVSAVVKQEGLSTEEIKSFELNF
jgi:hypothetical protein